MSPLRAALPLATTTMVAVLATFGTVLGLRYLTGGSAALLVLAVVLALSLARREAGRSRSARLLTLVGLPLVSVGASEVATLLVRRPDLGDALFVLAVTASLWIRRFGGFAALLGTVAALPLIALLIAPAPAAGPDASSHWWAALVALVALGWVTLCCTVAERLGWLPPAAVPEPAPSRRRAAAIDRMALRLLVALGVAFPLGRWLFGVHWPWLVITAFVVGSAGARHAQVLGRGVQRVTGAALGTLGATLLGPVAVPGSAVTVVLIFAVIALACWLRPLGYGYWAGGVTAVLALLYGYYGERGSGLLLHRLAEIALGAALAITVSWLVTALPARRQAGLSPARYRSSAA